MICSRCSKDIELCGVSCKILTLCCNVLQGAAVCGILWVGIFFPEFAFLIHDIFANYNPGGSGQGTLCQV